MLSASAHHTRDLLLSIIGRTGETVAGCLNMPEISIIGIMCIQSWNRFWCLVNAFIEIATIVTVVFSQDISGVLSGPVSGAGQFGRYH